MGLLDLFGFGKRRKMIQELVENGAIVIDVRTPGEFAGGHVEGSFNMPLDSIQSQVNQIKNMNKPVVLCCASGMRSGSAAAMLRREGIDAHNAGSWVNLNY